MRAAANKATPTNSLTRRDTVDRLTCSDLHDDGQHEWPAPGTLAEKAPQLDAQFLFDESLIGPFFEARLFDDLAEHPRPVGQQRLAVFHDEPARDDVGDAFEGAGLFVDRDHGDDQAVFGEMAAVAEHFVPHLAGARV